MELFIVDVDDNDLKEVQISTTAQSKFFITKLISPTGLQKTYSLSD